MTDCRVHVDYDEFDRNFPTSYDPEQLYDMMPVKEGLLLDLGSGPGLRQVRFREAGLRVVSVDVSLKQLRDLPGRARVQANANVGLPFGEAVFDFVLCSEVLEHLIEPERCVREIERTLRPGGSVLITTPCLNLPLHFLRSVYRRICGIDDKLIGHLHLFSTKQIMRMLGPAFEIEETAFRDAFTNFLMWRYGRGRRLSDRLIRASRRRLWKTILRFLAAQHLIRARRTGPPQS